MKPIEYFYYSQDGFTFFQNSFLDKNLIENLELECGGIRVSSSAEPEQSYDTLYLNGNAEEEDCKFLISYEDDDCYFRKEWLDLIDNYNKGL